MQRTGHHRAAALVERLAATDGPSPAFDWLASIDLSTRQLRVRGGRQAARDGVTVAVTGTVSSLDGARSDRPKEYDAVDVLDAYLQRGDALFPELRGQFGIAIADTRRDRVHVLRDPLGSHPLFYTRLPDRVLVAPQPRILLAEPGVSGDLNRAAIADHLCKRWPLRHETFFAAVNRLPPGWCATVSAAGLDARRYWNPVDDIDHIDYLDEEEVQRFPALLDLATARAFTGQQTGILLSGGFDSVSVAAVAVDLASRGCGPVPRAYSLGFAGLSADERPIQAGVARQLSLPFEMLDFDETVSPQGLMRLGLALNRGLDAPLFNNWYPAYLPLLALAREAGVDTLLTGEGGDEWLGTSPFLAADLLRGLRLPSLARLVATFKRSYDQTWPTVVRVMLWRYSLRPLLGQLAHALAPAAWDARRARRVVEATPAWIARDPRLRQDMYERALSSLAPASPPGGFYAREARVFLDHPLMSWLFEEQFAVGRPLGLRYVHPYWDPDLVAQVYRVAPERLNQGSRTKALIRQTVDARFPSLGFRRQRKVSATDYYADIVRREAPALAAELSDFRGLASLGIVEPKAAAALVTGRWDGTPRDVGLAWNLVNMEGWVRSRLAHAKG
ncbi:MAG: asparagine synthase-related protein [Acidobacteriota bacterium]|jgi:asparagine synthetase B (glutamine-hydrolysing)|nr:MAG: hypothetical protein DIU54_06550 [Acidobacteriota bacterium]